MLNNVFEPLPIADIQEKVDLNIRDWGYSLQQLKGLLEFEKSLIERSILREKWEFTKVEKQDLKTLLEDLLPREIQVQNLKEQIAYVDNLILKELNDDRISRISELNNRVHNENKQG